MGGCWSHHIKAYAIKIQFIHCTRPNWGFLSFSLYQMLGGCNLHHTKAYDFEIHFCYIFLRPIGNNENSKSAQLDAKYVNISFNLICFTLLWNKIVWNHGWVFFHALFKLCEKSLGAARLLSWTGGEGQVCFGNR